MAGNIFEFDLEFFEDGEAKMDRLTIRFVSRKCTRDYHDLMKMTYEVKEVWDTINDKVTELAAAEANKEDTELLEMELDELNTKLMSYNNDRNIQKRFEIIKRILEDNGILEEKYLTFEFWDEHIEPSTELDFLLGCIFKDDDAKKKHLKSKNLMKTG